MSHRRPRQLHRLDCPHPPAARFRAASEEELATLPVCRTCQRRGETRSEPGDKELEKRARQASPRIAELLRGGHQVALDTLLRLVVYDLFEAGQQPDANTLTQLGDCVVAAGLLEGYSRTREGNWLTRSAIQRAQRRFAELKATQGPN